MSYDIPGSSAGTQGHGGTLSLESGEGQGSDFIMTLSGTVHTSNAESV